MKDTKQEKHNEYISAPTKSIIVFQAFNVAPPILLHALCPTAKVNDILYNCVVLCYRQMYNHSLEIGRGKEVVADDRRGEMWDEQMKRERDKKERWKN